MSALFENSLSRNLPFLIRLSLRLDEFINFFMASDHAWGSVDGTERAPFPAISLMASSSDTMTGKPYEKASSTGMPKPSFTEGNVYTDAFS